MKSSPKGSAERLTTTADFFTKVQGLLLSAKNDRDGNALRRGAICIDSAAFSSLPNAAQEDLLELYSAAMMANGGLCP
jgi:hypothetical protein